MSFLYITGIRSFLRKLHYTVIVPTVNLAYGALLVWLFGHRTVISDSERYGYDNFDLLIGRCFLFPISTAAAKEALKQNQHPCRCLNSLSHMVGRIYHKGNRHYLSYTSTASSFSSIDITILFLFFNDITILARMGSLINV